MRFELREADRCTLFDLAEGTLCVGGTDAADLRILALTDQSIRLWVDGATWAFAASAQVEVSGVALYPEVRRLVLPGEWVRLAPGLELRALSESPAGDSGGEPAGQTHSLLRQWLRVAPRTPGPALTCLTGLDAGRVHSLGAEPMAIGRSLGAEVRVRDRTVSRLHARLTTRDGRHWLSPEESGNPVHLNGAALAAPCELSDGDILSLGYSQLRYSRPEPPPEPAPEVEPAAVAVSEPTPDAPDDLASSPLFTLPRAAWPWLAAGASLVGLGTILRFVL